MKKLFTLFIVLFTVAAYAQVTTVSNGLYYPVGLAIHGNDMYVSEYNGNKISKIDLNQTLPITATTVMSLQSPTGLIIIGDYLYFNTEFDISEAGETQTGRINLTAANPVIEQVLTTNAPGGLHQGFAHHGNYLYIANAGGDGGIYKIDLSQPLPQAPTTIYSGELVSGIAVHGDELYFSYFYGSTVKKINLTEANPMPVTVVTGLDGPDGLTFSGNILYISESANGGEIKRIDVTDATPTPVTEVSGLIGPTLSVFDGLDLYFGEHEANRVSKIAVHVLSFETPASVCASESSIQRGGGFPAGGVYSGANVMDNGDGETFTFNPQAAGAGMHVITYTFNSLNTTASIDVLAQPEASITAPSDVSCNGNADGAASVTATGGTAPYTYLWSNGSTTPSINNLGPGTYTPTVTDANGCASSSLFVTVNEPRALIATASSTPDDGTMSGSVSVLTSGGTPPYSFQWSNFATTASVYSLMSGTYSVTVSDANACSAISTVTVELIAAADFNECSTADDINALFGGNYNEAQTSMLYDNTNNNSINDPTIGYECFTDEALNHTLWLSFTGDGNTYRINTTDCSATNYIIYGDTQIAIYSGDCNNITPVACNDDENINADIYSANVELETEAGVNYYMMIDGWFGAFYSAFGEFCLEVTNLTSTGVNNTPSKTTEVFPNPTTDRVHFSNMYPDQVQVLDNLGRLVYTKTKPRTSIDISTLPSGIYFLKITEGSSVYSAKVMKE